VLESSETHSSMASEDQQSIHSLWPLKISETHVCGVCRTAKQTHVYGIYRSAKHTHVTSVKQRNTRM